MKVIDLLNKIANKEEIPLIKYNGRILHYDYLNEWFEDKRDEGFCKMEVYYEDLNDEVEIIEEPKKIEKIDILEIGKNIKDNVKNDFYFAYKINEIIDKINEVE